MEPENIEETIWELGLQPLDKLMEEYQLKNNDLVKHSDQQLSHKVVAKARRGRRLTKKSRIKVVHAFNATLLDLGVSEKKYLANELFNY